MAAMMPSGFALAGAQALRLVADRGQVLPLMATASRVFPLRLRSRQIVLNCTCIMSVDIAIDKWGVRPLFQRGAAWCPALVRQWK